MHGTKLETYEGSTSPVLREKCWDVSKYFFKHKPVLATPSLYAQNCTHLLNIAYHNSEDTGRCPWHLQSFGVGGYMCVCGMFPRAYAMLAITKLVHSHIHTSREALTPSMLTTAYWMSQAALELSGERIISPHWAFTLFSSPRKRFSIGSFT